MDIKHVLFVLLAVASGNCYVQIQTEYDNVPVKQSEDRSEMAQNHFQDISNDDSDEGHVENVDLESSSHDNDDSEALRAISSQFIAALLQLFDKGDELYRDARFDVIVQALKRAFLSMSGSIDYGYIDKLMRIVYNWDAEKRRRFNEQQENKLDLSAMDIEDFVSSLIESIKSSTSAYFSATKSPNLRFRRNRRNSPSIAAN